MTQTSAVPGVDRPSASASTPTPLVYLDQAAWRRLSQPETEESFYTSWLGVQCRMITGASCGVVAMASEGEALAPRAFWPDQGGIDPLCAEAAETAAQRRMGVVVASTTADGGTAVAYPLLLDSKLHGVVSVRLSGSTDTELQVALRQLQWGAAWLEGMIRREAFEHQAHAIARLTSTLDVVGVALEHQSFSAVSKALATDLATRLDCERVAIGLRHGRHMRVEAISHSADFARRMSLIRSIEAAMDEAADQAHVIYVPREAEDQPVVARAHEALLRAADLATGAVVTAPIIDRGEVVGAITFELIESARLTRDFIALAGAAASMTGPIAYRRWRDERFIGMKMIEAAGEQAVRLFGPGYIGRKLAVAALVATMAFFSLFTTMYRVSADTTLEGQVQRVVAAPFDGFVAQSLIRPGDAVAEGAVLARLDDRDLRLELAAWRSRLKQYQTEFERSLAQHNRASVAVVQAQMDEAVSQITLMEHKIARTVITAPFEALVIQGDLSQSLGLAVKQGQELFRLAPLSSYRLVVFVDERDMADIRTGQKGNLVLAAHPEDIYPITVERITPVSVAGQGRNTFRVEAEVQGAGRELRPGMTGVAKIQIEDRLLIWIWTRRFVHWLRLQIWSWLP